MLTKKSLFLISAILVAVFLLASCQPTNPTAAPPTAAPTKTGSIINPSSYTFDLPEAGAYDFGGKNFVISSYHAVFEQREDFARTYALIDEIQSRYNCTIEWVYPTRQAEIDASALVGAPIADIGSGIMCHQIVPMASAGIFVPLDTYKDKIKYDDARWEPSTKAQWNINGTQYGLTPKIQELWKYHYVDALFANKTLLKIRGVDIDELYAAQENKEWTWSKFAEAAQKVTADLNHDDIPDIYGCQASDYNWTTSFFVSAGTNVIKTDENGKMYFSYDQGVLDTLTFFANMVRSGASRNMVDANGTYYGDAAADFMNGSLGFHVEIFQRTWAYFASGMADPYGVFCIPLADGQTEYYLNDSMYRGNVIYNHSDKEFESAVADLYYLYATCLYASPEDEAECYWLEAENRIYDEGSRYFLDRVFERTNVIPTRNQELSHNGFQFNIIDVLSGTKTPQEYLSEIAPVVQSMIDSYYDFTK
ncbi:MAG: extracellular solute-binding protein [Eubacteriales bacterium]|nr:extracellular solute-binding protein [Eubacteriales bacterium]